MICYARKCLVNHASITKVCTTKTLRKNDKKENTYLIRIYFFFANFLIESYYLDHLLLKQAFFVKTSFWSFSKWYIYIFLTTHIILDRTSSSHFYFYQFSFDTQKYFFQRKRIRHSSSQFFVFLFKIDYHPISRKRKNENPFFVFFRNWKHIFCFDK